MGRPAPVRPRPDSSIGGRLQPMNTNMDRARRRGPRRPAWLVAAVGAVVAAQLTLAGVAGADTTSTDPSTTVTNPPTTSTTVRSTSTTTAGNRPVTKGSATTVTIP